MVELGWIRYNSLPRSKKKKIIEAIGPLSGGSVGIATITSIISSSGVVTGLSATGITSGLAAIGGIIGKGMLAGVLFTAAIPIVATCVGYGILKGIQYLISRKQLNNKKINPKWELQKVL